jgi:hypothetical protein
MDLLRALSTEEKLALFFGDSGTGVSTQEEVIVLSLERTVFFLSSGSGPVLPAFGTQYLKQLKARFCQLLHITVSI